MAQEERDAAFSYVHTGQARTTADEDEDEDGPEEEEEEEEERCSGALTRRLLPGAALAGRTTVRSTPSSEHEKVCPGRKSRGTVTA